MAIGTVEVGHALPCELKMLALIVSDGYMSCPREGLSIETHPLHAKIVIPVYKNVCGLQHGVGEETEFQGGLHMFVCNSCRRRHRQLGLPTG